MDSSVNKAATGGINKETSSPCFSPHHYLHQQAVDAAITVSSFLFVTSEYIIKEPKQYLCNDKKYL